MVLYFSVVKNHLDTNKQRIHSHLTANGLVSVHISEMAFDVIA